METTAVIFERPECLSVRSVGLSAKSDGDLVVDVEWSGVSTGTERLLWSGQMPEFPGMGYPLVPGYESVGRVVESVDGSGLGVGDRVFVPGANCFTDARGLFGGAAARLVVPSSRVVPLDENLGENGVLIALAATAHHAVAGGTPPDLIVGHGVLGRLLARITTGLGHPAPTVWEVDPVRMDGASGYQVTRPDDDPRRDYGAIYDVSGDSKLLDSLIARLRPCGEVVLAGFYSEPLSFAFPPAFMREARLRVSAEWKEPDLTAVSTLIRSGLVSLQGLITHRQPVDEADEAYRTAFNDPACLKLVLDWRNTP